MKFEFRILGPLEVYSEAGRIALGAHKQRALLAALLLRANQVVPSDQLIEMLWHERPPKTARTLLQAYVSQLRKRLGHERINTSPPGYRLHVDLDELDAERFQRLLDEAAAAEPAAAAARLAEALAMWRGPALADLAYEDFAQSEIAQLEELRLVALEERLEAELTMGHHARLVGELEGAIAKHPLRERLRGQLILALYRSGRQADALDAYRDTRRVLVDELGIEPSAALKELERRILEQDPGLAIPASAVGVAHAAEDRDLGGQEVHFVEIEGSTLAYALAGKGPPLIIPCWWIVGIEEELAWPSLARFIAELARSHTIIRYNRPDPSGQIRAPRDLTAEVRVLADVVERVSGQPTALLGVSCGSSCAIALAAERPDLVDRLVLYAPFPDGARLATPEVQGALLALTRAHWGLGSNTLADIAMPDGQPADKSFFNELQRRGTTGEEAAVWLEYVYGVTVSQALSQIDAPVLVVHRTGDRLIPLAHGRETAARIAGARFVPLPGRDHFPWVGDSATLLKHITSFLAARPLARSAADHVRRGHQTGI